MQSPQRGFEQLTGSFTAGTFHGDGWFKKSSTLIQGLYSYLGANILSPLWSYSVWPI
jgi:hypothetical protein